MHHTILLTGATGFLGGATAARLLDTGTRHPGRRLRLLLLVRAATPAEGLARVRRSLARFQLPAAVVDGLTEDQIVCGDLSDVAAFATDPRLDGVTEVINCAAVASFSDHPDITPVNVHGTLAFGRRMAAVPGLRRFLHVGTAMACGANQPGPVVTESWDLPVADGHLVPYTASKAEAERRLRVEVPTLPLVVARPSIVIGHSELGCGPSSSIFWLFRAVFQMKKYICGLDTRIDVIPVDYCAGALVHLALAERLGWDLYHVSAGVTTHDTMRSINETYAAALGVAPMAPSYQRVDYRQLAQAVREIDVEPPLNGADRRLLTRALALYGRFAELGYAFANTRLLAEGFVAPPHFSQYVRTCATSIGPLSLAEQMLDDIK